MSEPIWSWADYKLSGKPEMAWGDQTFKACGRDEEINDLLSNLEDSVKTLTRVFLRLRDYWGAGKSTFLYNLCERINDELFFKDRLGLPAKGNYTHVLAFYLKAPRRYSDSLEFVNEHGLPKAWGPRELARKHEIREERKQLWYKCIRRLAFIFLRKALNGLSRHPKLKERAIAGSALRKGILDKVESLNELKTGDLIKKVDEMYEKEPRLYEEIGALLRYYMETIMEPINISRVLKQKTLEELFPSFLYPVTSMEFITTWRQLFGEARKGLRNFIAFETFCRHVDTYLFLVTDEVEDWSTMAREKVDVDVSRITTGPPPQILGLILTFRTEVIARLRRSSAALERFVTISERLNSCPLNPFSEEKMVAITESFLDMKRVGEPSLIPCTEGFVEELAKRTRRLGRNNVRTYLRALVRILESSRMWKRPSVELTEDLLKRDEVKIVIKEVLEKELASAKTLPSGKIAV